MDQKVRRAAELLGQALNALNETTDSNSTSCTSASTPSLVSSIAPQPHTITDTLTRARGMINSASRGFFTPNRRLNSTERLRASVSVPQKKQKLETKKKDATLFNFVLLQAETYDGEEGSLQYTVSDDCIVKRGMVAVSDSDSENEIRKKIVNALKDLPLLAANDFEFVKVIRETVHTYNLADGMEYNYNVIKKLVGQGTLYIRIKSEYKFIYEDAKKHKVELDELSESHSSSSHDSSTQVGEILDSPSGSNQLANNETLPENVDNVDNATADTKDRFDMIIKSVPKDIMEPVELLQFYRSKVLRGRPLDITDPSVVMKGEVNDIFVDRDSILSSTFEELKEVADISVTFCVQFFGELAEDHGGPRKEWLRLCNHAIYAKYFESGLKDYLLDDYFYVGQMLAIAIIQNGDLPKFLPEDILQKVFNENESSNSQCINKLRLGVDKLGLQRLGNKFPMFLHLLRPNSSDKLTHKKLIHLLAPNFSEQGSNSFKCEKECYALFIYYCRECVAGRRVVSLENILEFVTCSSEAPVGGFSIAPSIQFVPAEMQTLDEEKEICEDVANRKEMLFIPSASTCSNQLILKRATTKISLPNSDNLFNIYDLAFKNSYFGLK